MKNTMTFCLNTLTGCLIAAMLTGCSASQEAETAPQPMPLQDSAAVQETTDVSQPQTQPQVPVENESTASNTDANNDRAKVQIEIAQRYIEMAQQGRMPYVQAVAICRDVIKNNPNTEYEARAQELLRQIPQEKLDRFNISQEELGL